MPSVQVNDTRLAYVEAGTHGDPVVLVHGTLGDYRNWGPQLEAFAESHRTIAYSRRYHYPNECHNTGSDYSAATHAEDLAELIGALGLGSAHVVGQSYGAYTALFLAARHPEQVRSLVLAEPPVLPLLEQHPEGRTIRDAFLTDVWEPVGEMMRNGQQEEGLRIMVDAMVGDGAFDSHPPEIQQLILQNACEFRAESSRNSSATCRTPSACASRVTTTCRVPIPRPTTAPCSGSWRGTRPEPPVLSHPFGVARETGVSRRFV